MKARIARRRPAMWLLAAALGGLPAAAAGQDLAQLVDEILDQTVTTPIEITERPIGEALAALEKQTDLKFLLHEMVIPCMPYGERTRIAITIRDMPLREGLRRVFDGLGLEMHVEGDKVLLGPAPVLERIGRRMTIVEVGLLGKLARQTWSQLQPGEVPLQFPLAAGANGAKLLEERIARVPADNAAEQLEAATGELGWVWVPENDRVLILPRREDVRRRLGRTLSLSYSRIPLDELLVDLGGRVGLTMHFEPGSLQAVAARERPVDLVRRQTTVLQTLEQLCGNTGLRYEIVDDGVKISAPEGRAAGGSSGPRVTAILRVPVGDDGTTIEFLIRDDALPPEFSELFRRKLPVVIEELRRQLAP